ncbi:unnamed protein product [Rotaria socialis]|uniref:Uncharacterized protein n=1 Tax=Rotaria socialis TaxID=392032 RepID=A0A817LV47_9BILA|nr:unnamed protein product [Rotaria socialis]
MVVSICCISLIILIRVTWLVDLSCSLMRTQYEHQEDIALARGTALAGTNKIFLNTSEQRSKQISTDIELQEDEFLPIPKKNTSLIIVAVSNLLQ